jgi:hypothetical protein
MTVTILQVVPRLDSGGSEQATVEVTEALTRAGAKAIVATEGGRLTVAIARAGGEVILLPMASKNPLTMVLNARRLKSRSLCGAPRPYTRASRALGDWGGKTNRPPRRSSNELKRPSPSY